jgi:methionyl-tRNA formyltransferase
MKIVFMGTPGPAAKCLQALIDAQEEVVLAVSQPDRPKGRHLLVSSSPVKELARKYNIHIETPEKVRDPIFINKIKSYLPDLIVIVAYGRILPREILTIPKFGSINLHASLLPKYRGAAPIQWAILKGEAETGITVMRVAEALDTGDILLQKKVGIDPEDTAETLEEKLFEAGASVLLEAIQQIKEGKAQYTPQKEAEATYAALITKESGEIDWKKPAFEINNRIRALIPWPAAHTFYQGKMLKLFKAEPIELNGEYKPGQVVEPMVIACAPGGLRLKEVQPASGRRMPAEDFWHGHKIKAGDIFPS